MLPPVGGTASCRHPCIPRFSCGTVAQLIDNVCLHPGVADELSVQ